MNYYALHYHMKGSGVKFVIDNIFECLRLYSKETKLHLIYSETAARYTDKDVDIINIPEVDYDDRIFNSKDELEIKATEVKDKIKANLDLSKPCILHTHNVNLMKNTYLGRALQFLADENKNLLLIMHVHDFPEDKKDRLKLMQNCTGTQDKKFANKLAYPLASNIIYCTINSRDKDLLEKINIPKNRIFLFPNNIDIDFLQSNPKNEGLKDKIDEYAKNKGYTFGKERKILLSPLKIIKRKNVIETLLILKLLNHIKDDWQLLITLDAHSKADKEYSEKIKNYVKKNKLPVVIGFGYELISPNKERKNNYNIVDLFGVSDFIITTSKQEGFGMTYLEAWVAKKPVIGRRINFIFKDFENNKINLSHFYNKVEIGGKDFKDYSEDKQLDLLENIDYTILKKTLQNLLDFIKTDNKKIIKNNKENIIKHYSLKNYNKNLINMIKRGFELKEHKINTKINNSVLIDYFKP